MLHPSRDCLEVGEGATQPAIGDVGHVAAGRICLDRLLSLLFRTHEEDRSPPGDQVAHPVIGGAQLLDCLLQVDDMDTVTFGKDEASHSRVPALSLMTEV